MDIEEVKKNFYEIRRRKGLKWDDLAKAAGVNSYQQIINYFSGGMTFASICKLAALLGVDPWELLKPVDDDNNEQNKLPQIICPHCGKAITISVKEN